MSEMVNWRRQRKNRYGPDLVTVKVVGETPAGYCIVERVRPPRLREAVHPRNIEAVHTP